MTNKKETTEPVVETTEELIEPTLEELIEEAKAEQEPVDPTAPTISMQEMSLMLTNQTYAIIGGLGSGLKARYDQVIAMQFENLPPQARKEKKAWQRGYMAALNDVAAGLAQYQDEVTERLIADGVMSREEVAPDLPEPEATATEADGQSE